MIPNPPTETGAYYHIKRHYCASHETINPTRIVPKGPVLDFTCHMIVVGSPAELT